MKKLLALLLPLIIVLTLVGCSDNHTYSTDPTDAPTIPTTDPIGNATDRTTEPPHIHEYQISDTIGASCTEGGYTVYVCACGDTYQADETEALGHSFGEWITVKEPTEIEEGEAKHICSVCGAEETRVLSKLIPDHTHSYAEEITKAATCTEEGSVTYTCACGDTYSESTPKTAHDYTDSLTAATCTNGGYTTHTCTACGYSYVDERTDATDHSWGEWVTTQEPTTTSTGTAERTCSNCGTKETKTLDKLIENHTHSYTEEVTQKPTCTEDGVKTFTCACGSSYTESISKLGHDYASEETAPSCTTDGHTTHTCSRCDSSYSDNFVPATGHSYTAKVTTEATCTTDGVKTYTCSNCSDQYTESIAKLGHDYEKKVTAPTCTQKGYTTYTCSRCGASYKDDYTDMVDHNYTSKVTVEPTCTKEGVRTYTCACGKYYTESVAKIPHEYVDKVVKPTCTEAGYTEHTCSMCSYSYNDSTVPATGHQNTKTETSGGYKTVTCTDCGTVISKTPVSSGHTCTYVTKNLAEAVAADIAAGYYDFVRYADWFDWNVQVCSGCGWIDEDTIEFAYTDMEAAEIMLGYVNELRVEVLGQNYKLTVDKTLVELAKIRAKEISVNFSHHGGTYTNAGENIQHDCVNIYDQYVSWYKSQGHYENMIIRGYEYFGYATYRCSTGAVYCVQLFWSGSDRLIYLQSIS